MIVLDASVLVKWIKEDEEDADKARLLYFRHKNNNEKIVVPYLIFIELANYLATKSQTSKILIEKALNYLFDIDLGVYQVERNDLIEAAVLAKQYKTSVYDMLYALIAKRHKTLLVTADERFVKVTKFPFVKTLSEYKPKI